MLNVYISTVIKESIFISCYSSSFLFWFWAVDARNHCAPSAFNFRPERNTVPTSSGTCLTLIMWCRAVLKIKAGLLCPLRAAYFITVIFHLWPCALYGSFCFCERAMKSCSILGLWECWSTEPVFLRVMFGSYKEPVFCKCNVWCEWGGLASMGTEPEEWNRKRHSQIRNVFYGDYIELHKM